jgi:hypothetical protein
MMTCSSEHIPQARARPHAVADGTRYPVRGSEGGFVVDNVMIVLPAVAVTLNHGDNFGTGELGFEVLQSESCRIQTGTSDGQSVCGWINIWYVTVVTHKMPRRGCDPAIGEIAKARFGIVWVASVGKKLGFDRRIVDIRIAKFFQARALLLRFFGTQGANSITVRKRTLSTTTTKKLIEISRYKHHHNINIICRYHERTHSTMWPRLCCV